MITQENIPYTADEIKAMVKTCEKYNEALEKARELMDKGYDVLMPEIFPELKESEDDRIVRCLLNYFNHVRYNGLDLKDTDVDEVIAWLKKQKN